MRVSVVLIALLGSALAVAMAGRECFAHGNPILVNEIDDKLIVSGGLATPQGFGFMTFDDNEEESYLQLGTNFRQTTDTPGVEIGNIDVGSQLHIEVLPRRDFSNAAEPLRWMWFWNKETQQLETAPANPTLEIASKNGFGSIVLTQFAPPTTPSSIKFMEPEDDEIGVHEDPFRFYVDDSPSLPFGAYGFFARLASPNYQSSEPFLIALNHSLSHEEYVLAAKQISAAARLPGDFDKDDDDDGSDFLGWQRTFGSTTSLAADWELNDVVDGADLAKWRTNFGRVVTGVAASSGVPEPATGWGFVFGAAAIRMLLRRRFQQDNRRAALP